MAKRQFASPRYKGRLTAPQVAGGINVALRNARRLLSDARLLLQRGRFPSAAALAFLAIEEASKSWILRLIAVAKTEEELREYWNKFYSHTSKNAEWVLDDYTALLQPSTASDYLPLYDEEAPHRSLGDLLKQQSLYSDFAMNGDPMHPEDIIDEQVAKHIVANASSAISERVVTAEEIELWIQYVGPVWKTTKDQMRAGFRTFFREATARGLISEDIGRVEEFFDLADRDD